MCPWWRSPLVASGDRNLVNTVYDNGIAQVALAGRSERGSQLHERAGEPDHVGVALAARGERASQRLGRRHQRDRPRLGARGLRDVALAARRARVAAS